MTRQALLDSLNTASYELLAELRLYAMTPADSVAGFELANLIQNQCYDEITQAMIDDTIRDLDSLDLERSELLALDLRYWYENALIDYRIRRD